MKDTLVIYIYICEEAEKIYIIPSRMGRLEGLGPTRSDTIQVGTETITTTFSLYMIIPATIRAVRE